MREREREQNVLILMATGHENQRSSRAPRQNSEKTFKKKLTSEGLMSLGFVSHNIVTSSLIINPSDCTRDYD